MKTEIEVGSTKYYLSRLDTTLLDKFIKWAESVLPDPIEKVREQIKGFPPEVQSMMVKRAMDELSLRRSGQSADIQGLLASPEGARKFIGLLLSKHQPSMTDQEVSSLILACEEEHGLEYLRGKLESAMGLKKKPDQEEASTSAKKPG